MIKNQYQTVSVFEQESTDGVGTVVSRPRLPSSPILDVETLDAKLQDIQVPSVSDLEPNYVLSVTHSRLCVSDLPDNVIDVIKQGIEKVREDHQSDAVACRQKLANLFEYDGNLGEILPGTQSPVSSSLCGELPGRKSEFITIHGSIGSGKSVLASQISNEAKVRAHNAVVLSFQFSTADYRRSSYHDLLLSFLLQILYSGSKARQMLYAMLIRLSETTVVCVIDALDQCDEESRGRLVGDFKRMVLHGLTKCRVFVTCRRSDAIIAALLGPLDKDNSVDLDENMTQIRGALMTRALECEKFANIRDRLEKEDATPLKIRLIAALDWTGQMPSMFESVDYSTVYRQLMRQIEAPQTWLQEMLLCVAFAQRPLTVGELAAAMGLERSQEPGNGRLTLQKIRVGAPKQLQGDLELAAASLVRVENNVVHLGTLRDFLRNHPDILSQSTAAEPLQGNQVAGPSKALRKCLLMLSIPEIREIEGLASKRRPFDVLCDSSAALQLHSFAGYAGYCWPRHLTEAAEDADGLGKQNCFSLFWDNLIARYWWIGTFTSYPAVSIGNEDLRLAASLGIRPAVKSLLKKADGETSVEQALSAAVRRGDTNTVQTLFHKAADTGKDLWLSVLESSFAASNGRDGIISELLAIHDHMIKRSRPTETSGEESNEGTDRGEADNAQQQRTGKSFETGDTTADKPTDLADRNPEGEAGQEIINDSQFSEALVDAAEFGSAAVVRLLAPRADIEHREGVLKFSALHCAAAQGNTEAIEQLLDHNADIECQDQQDATPLLLACLNGHVHTAQVLLARGANPDHAAARSAKYRALHLAARDGNAALVRLLFESGASENAHLEKPEWDTPLHLAIKWLNKNDDGPHVEVVRTLLAFGADVDAPDGEGSTAMHAAILTRNECSEAMVRILLEFGADIDKTDSSDRSPLYYAIRDNSKFAKVLWDPTGFTSKRGASVLFDAASQGNLSRVEQLLDAGCNKMEQDVWGRTAFDVALTPKVRRLLAPADEAAPQDTASEDWCPSATDRGGPCHALWYCDPCNQIFKDETFYHCCACSGNCAGLKTYDLCERVFRESACKEKQHKVRRRFTAAGLTSYEECSPNLAVFGCRSVATNDTAEAETRTEASGEDTKDDGGSMPGRNSDESV
ncbi:putative ankyrin repeat domain protein [Diplogelasinospora grovesii]|uniref:Ankyrin repeat domain protein n=1 Tax=Diplogelasinospora grovesii TaxID=303347 RepID=A0AAN6S1F7_9PEZI|nr:putative ankyrin repeat domain protein [Diplogelasinospora grovesii]